MSRLVTFANFRTLLALLLAFAVLLAPGISGGDALAAVPHDDMQMMQSWDCHSPAPRSDRHHAADLSCCVSINAGIAGAVDALPSRTFDQVAPAPLPLAAPHRPFLGELPTPPPRSA